jgi:hypothetical protein
MAVLVRNVPIALPLAVAVTTPVHPARSGGTGSGGLGPQGANETVMVPNNTLFHVQVPPTRVFHIVPADTPGVRGHWTAMRAS